MARLLNILNFNSMEATTRTTPRDVFLHLLLIVTLAISVISCINLVFQYVNVLIPDELTAGGTVGWDTVRWSSASLLIALPVFLFLSWQLERMFQKQPEHRGVAIRKWLVYLLLFVAAVTIIIDLIRLVGTFFGGSLTLQFSLKALWVLLVAAAIFGYYRWDLSRGATSSPTKLPRLGGGVTAVVGLAAIIAGFFVIGTPAQQRQYRLDEQRVSDLQSIENTILYSYFTPLRKLPVDLAELETIPGGIGEVPTDPLTRESYTYRTSGQFSFELCATFAAPTAEVNRGRTSGILYAKPLGQPTNWSWDHGAGETCFSRTIDPKLFPQPLVD